MNNSETILSELKEVSPLIASIDKQSVFTVPDGYFLQLPQAVLSAIKLEMLLVNSLNIYSVPKNYFENFSASVLSQIKNEPNEVADELNEIAPFLNTISKQNPYSVPENYFENCSVKKEKPAKIILFSKSRKWITYAAAAIMAGVLVTGVFVNQSVRSSSTDITNEVKKLSDEELNAYAKEQSIGFSESVVINEDVNVPESLKILSDDELQKYLDDNNVMEQSDTTN